MLLLGFLLLCGLILGETDCAVQDHNEFFKVAIKRCFSLAQQIVLFHSTVSRRGDQCVFK